MTHDVLVPISALEHWSYCPRQCGLIHLESVWDENVFTVRGAHAHERADEPVGRVEKGVKVERALPIWSDELGLVGKADVVEFREPSTNPLPKEVGRGSRIVPVEYKSGGPRHERHAAIQLCAQALCLEEMFETRIEEGALYFGKTKERKTVAFDDQLRKGTLEAIGAVRRMLAGQSLPPALNDRRCPRCSLIDACLPRAVATAGALDQTPFVLRNEVELP
ncbi:MAG: CRISPR-associated protein Cas4 [Fimbriimonadaceae bacterium]|nr:MAG: CRISPR-associated protein Cas4 [Fimbriimonadaceae bacterium]